MENHSSCIIILACHHTMIREGFLKFCLDDNQYSLEKSFHSINHIRKEDFNPDTGLVLICDDCNRRQLDDPDRFLPQLSLYFPGSKLVIINSECEQDEMIRLITLGIKGFFPKKFSPEDIKKAFKALSEGETWVSRRLTDGLLNRLIRETTDLKLSDPENRFNLSAREIEIIKAMAAGLSNHEIGDKLYISEKTVKAHAHHIFKKMGVKNRIQAVMKARQNNLT